MLIKYCNPLPFLVSRPLVAEINDLPVIKVTPEQIINLVCDSFNITKDQILSKRRKRIFSDPRKVATKLMLNYLPDLRLKEIGGILHQHYSTVIYNRETIEDILKTDKALKNKYNGLVNDIVLIINNG